MTISAAPPTLTSWRLSALAFTLALAMAVAALPLNVYGVVSPFLVAELGMSRSQLGVLLTANTGIAAALSPAMGRVADIVGGRATALGMFALGTAILLAVAAAPAFGWLVVAALVGGTVNAAGNPATNRLIGAHVTAGRRGLTMGVKQSGVQGGLALAGAYIPVAALAFGWRTAVATMAALPLLGLLLAVVVVPRGDDGRPPAASSAVRYRHPPTMWWLTGYAFLMGSGQSVMTGFLPLYLHESLGWSVTSAGAAAAVLGVSAIVFRIAAGRLSERARHMSGPLAVQAVMAAVSLGLVLAGASLPALVWVAVVLAAASLHAWNAVAMLAVIVEADPQHTGRASGLVVAGFMAGMTSSPILFGYSADVTGGYTIGWIGVLVCCCAAFAVALRWRSFVK